jgi:hypothetical protein
MLKENTKQETYKIVTVEKSPAPRGMTGDDWHHYVIGRGDSIIEGSKVGTLKEVTEHAKDLAERINARSDKYGVTYVSSYSPRKKIRL